MHNKHFILFYLLKRELEIPTKTFSCLTQAHKENVYLNGISCDIFTIANLTVFSS